MTAQIGDIYKRHNDEYTIVAISAPLSFDPKNYGLEPHPSSTACYRGYWCEYDITDDGLFLENLYLFNGDGNYPEFLGKSIAPIEYQECDCYRGKKKTRKKIPRHMGHRVYKDVHLLIPYTGKVLLGKDFLREYYIHMGYQRPFAYKTLVEYVFEEGIPLDIIDHSKTAEKLRESIDLKDPMWKYREQDIPQFVEDSFSLDYKTKAWWLPG